MRKKFSQTQIALIQCAICIVDAAVIYGINLAYNAGYVNRWVALVLTIGIMALCYWSIRPKYWKTRER